MSQPDRSIGEIELALKDALAVLEERKQVSREANSAESEARNKVNELQKEFDAKAEAMRAHAPRDTDWHHKIHMRKLA